MCRYRDTDGETAISWFLHGTTCPTGNYSILNDESGNPQPERSSCLLAVAFVLMTCFSYTLLGLLFPLMYWVCIKKLGAHDRLVLFRLGKMVGVKGPGKVRKWANRFAV